MLHLLLAAVLAVSDPKSCLPPDPADVVVERVVLDRKAGPLEAYSVSRKGENGQLGYDSARVVVYAADCQVMHQQLFDGAMEAHFTLTRLGDLPILVATAMTAGGSGDGFQEVVLAYDDDGVFALAPARLQHSNMDGFHVGDLGGGRGPGLMTWSAEWDGAHYEPHRYRVTTWRWRDDRFVGPEAWTTRKRYDPDPEAVAKALGLPEDQTQKSRFKLIQ